MPLTRSIAATALAASLLAQASPATAQGEPSPLELAQSAKLDYVRHIRQAGKCRWDTPTMGTAIYSNSDMYDRMAAIATNNPGLEIPLQAIDDHPCGSEQDNITSWTSTGLYWQWLTRLKLMAVYNNEAGWSYHLAEIPASVVVGLDPVLQSIEQQLIEQAGREAMQQEMTVLAQEVQAVMALACEGRREIRSPSGPRACPELPAEMLADRPYALARLTVAENLGRVLVDDLAREQRREYGDRWQVNLGLISGDCEPRMYSYFPQAPDTVEQNGVLDVALHQYGSIVGRARIQIHDTGAVQLIDSDNGMIEAELDEFDDLPFFGPCFNS